MAKHAHKSPKVRVNKIVKGRKTSKLTIFNTILIIGLYLITFRNDIKTFINKHITEDILTESLSDLSD